MPKQKQNRYLVSVSFSTAAFGSGADVKQFYEESDLLTFLIVRGFSIDVAFHIAKELKMEHTRDLSYMSVEDVEDILPDLTEENKKHLSDIIAWAQEHTRMITYNCA